MQSHISLLDLPDLKVYQFEKKVPTVLKGGTQISKLESWKMTECSHGSAMIVTNDKSIQVYLRK